jgi:hypothetical protein
MVVFVDIVLAQRGETGRKLENLKLFFSIQFSSVRFGYRDLAYYQSVRLTARNLLWLWSA